MFARNKMVLLSLICIVGIALYTNKCVFKSTEEINFTDYSDFETIQNVGELTSDITVVQEFYRPYQEIDGMELQFANYSDRLNKGIVNIKVFNEEEMLANINYDVSKIGDGEYIKVPFDSKKGHIGDKMSVKIDSDSKAGSAVTLWLSENVKLKKLDGFVKVNGNQVEKNLHIKLRYISPKINNIWWLVAVFIAWLTIPSGICNRLVAEFNNNEKFRHKVLGGCKGLLFIIVGFVLLSFRDLSYITAPALYGEDGRFINNILNKGFIESAISTRGGGNADFQNTGSYILLYLALQTTKLFFGYNIAKLPIFIGVYANLFWAITAFIAYKAFRTKARELGFIAYLIIILVPMGAGGGAVFGRVLNTVFLWPVSILMLLIIQYDKKYKLGCESIAIGIGCIIGGLSFPITYGIVGVYLLFSFLRLLKERNFCQWFLSNSLQIISLFIGVVLLPMIVQQKGLATQLELKADAIIEFILGRHILYPFINSIYNHMSDTVVVFLFTIYCITVLYAMLIEARKTSLFNCFTMLICTSALVSFSSAFMRIEMTAVFNNYQSSSPDHYYYGSNMLCAITLVYAVYIILLKHKVSVRSKQAMLSFFVVLLVVNPFLFELDSPRFNIRWEKDEGDFQECILNAVDNSMLKQEGKIHILVYPIVKSEKWYVDLPYSYAFSTAFNK
jgi:hypothetical protein